MKSKKVIIISITAIIAIILILTFLIIKGYIKFSKNEPIIKNGKIDDWQFSNTESFIDNIKSNLGFDKVMTESEYSSALDSTNIGFSTGGSKDINNFRQNIENGYFPISTDITYNGLFYDYTFNTGKATESNELFSPSYSKAISKDPISNNKDYYMTVGLNSNIKESDFSRKKLNLVVVLDISGSMTSKFNSYYYDANRNKSNSSDENKTKMQIANESVNILIDQLKTDDRFGMILFDDKSYLGKPLSLVGDTDIEAIKNHILEIEANGGTNFEAGYTSATDLYKEYINIDTNEYENRIIVITDAMPNSGTTSSNGLLKYVEENSKKGIYTSFIGVGVDFNSELIEKISNVKGANYYSVHNSEEFKERMGDSFEYMVTPLVFDLQLNLESEDYKIASVYGSDTVNKENGNIMNVNTLFPSKTTSSGEVKGGVVLLKLNKKNNNSGNIKLNVSYKDRNGQSFSNSQVIQFTDSEEFYENTGIRKAILLSRYANTLKNWILYERTENERFILKPDIGITDCIISPEEVYRLLGENERTSVKLTVSSQYKNIFNILKEYIKSENTYINDSNLNKEIELLEKLSK